MGSHLIDILTRQSRLALYKKVLALLNEGGNVYLSTARYIPKDGKHGPRHRLQNYVVLDLPVVYADEKQEIYQLAYGEKVRDKTKEFEDQF